jgi:hypothetical protein
MGAARAVALGDPEAGRFATTRHRKRKEGRLRSIGRTDALFPPKIAPDLIKALTQRGSGPAISS